MIPPCPDCGSRFTVVNVQARGPGQYQYGERGQFLEASYDQLYFAPSKTVRCADCNKIRRDLALVDSQIRVREGEDEGKA